MAVVIIAPVTEIFDPNVVDGSGGFALHAALNNNNLAGGNILAPRPKTFSTEGTLLGDESNVVGNSVIRLGVLGVPFPAGTSRILRLKIWAKRAAAPIGFVEQFVSVTGGTTPTAVTDTTGAVSASTSITKAFAQTGTDVLTARATGEVGGVFVNLINSAAASMQTPVQVAAGIRYRLEVTIDPLTIMASP